MAEYSSLSGVSSSAYGAYTKENHFADEVKKTISKTSKNSTKDELWDACKQFEAYFLEQVFKSMEESVTTFSDRNEDSIGSALSMDATSNSLVDYFKNQTLQDIASTTTNTQSTGLAKMLYENMKRTYGIGEIEEGTEKKAGPAKEA